MWSILIVTLPTQPSAVRLRIWRALKALGCAALRDGAYLLPLDQAPALEALGTEVREHGGTASVLTLSPKDEAQRLEILTQFDRTEAYTAWHESLRSAFAEFGRLSETEARRRVRGVADALLTLQRIDYYPGPASAQADTDLIALRRELDKRFSKGEPQATAGDIPRLDARKFQGKRWATRARPWVDRLACAWLITRFIDKEARQDISNEYDYQNTGMVADETKKGPGGQTGADFIINGRLDSIVQEVGKDKSVYYKLTLNLTNLKTGVISWTNQKQLRKTFKKKSVGL